MYKTERLVDPLPWSNRVTTTASHPQLRDLLVFNNQDFDDDNNSVTVPTYDSIANHSLWNDRRPIFTPLKFTPCCLTKSSQDLSDELLIVGGQNSEIAFKLQEQLDWCHVYTPFQGIGGGGGSIVNSLNCSPNPTDPEKPRLLLSSNDECIKVFDIVRGQGEEGDGESVPDYRNRRRMRNFSYSSSSSQDSEEEEVETTTTSRYNLLPRPELTIPREIFKTPINHCSISPDGKRLVAVGDSSDVFLFDINKNYDGGEYILRQVIQGGDMDGSGRKDASFTTDWEKSNGNCFVIGSQDGIVTIYDQRQLPSSSCSSSSSRTSKLVAKFETSQKNSPSGAVRKVSFSPGGNRKLDGGFLAFTEHRNRLHLIDSKSFESLQTLEIPGGNSSSNNYFNQLHQAQQQQQLQLQRPRRRRRVESNNWILSEEEETEEEGREEDGLFPLRNRPLPPHFRGTTTTTMATRRNRRPTGSDTTVTTRNEYRVSSINTDREVLENQDLDYDQVPLASSSSRESIRIATELENERTATRGNSGEGGGGRRRRRIVTMEMPDEGRGQVWPTPRNEGGGMEINPAEVQHRREGESGADVGSSDDDDTSDEVQDSEEEEEEEEDDSNPSSINSTRPRRFQPQQQGGGGARQTYSSVAATSRAIAAGSSRIIESLDERIPYTTLSRYSTSPPVTTNSSTSLFAAPLLSNEGSSTPTNTTATTTTTSSRNLARIYPFSVNPVYSYATNSASARLGATEQFPQPYHYRNHSNNGNFPIDTSEYDLLGMDWDQKGERLLVATAKRVWEWDVDTRARRCRGVFQFQ